MSAGSQGRRAARAKERAKERARAKAKRVAGKKQRAKRELVAAVLDEQQKQARRGVLGYIKNLYEKSTEPKL